MNEVQKAKKLYLDANKVLYILDKEIDAKGKVALLEPCNELLNGRIDGLIWIQEQIIKLLSQGDYYE